MSGKKRTIVRRTEQQMVTVPEGTCIEIRFKPATNAEPMDDDIAPREPYKIREKVGLPSVTTSKPKILWGGFAGGPYKFYLRDGSEVIGVLSRQTFLSYIKIFNVTIINRSGRTTAKWMMLDGAEVKAFIPIDASTEPAKE